MSGKRARALRRLAIYETGNIFMNNEALGRYNQLKKEHYNPRLAAKPGKK